jgi:hypothetical protein
MIKKSHHTKAHTFTSRTSQHTDQSLQKSVLFSHLRTNSIIFSPTFRCFNFLANTQPTTDKQLDSLLQTLIGQCNLTRKTEARTANTGFASGGLTCKLEALCFYSSSVLVDSFVLRNPPERKVFYVLTK